jgi:hypothetical protein
MVCRGNYLYAIGGVIGECSMERYDPTSNEWEEIGQGPASQEFGATLIQDDNICITGLSSDSTKIFDFTNNSWFHGPLFPEEYGQYGANTLVYLDGYIYSIGARDAPGDYYGFVWRAKSTIPPLVNHPNDMQIAEGSSGPISVIWSPLDNNPAFYNITNDGNLIDSGIWNGGIVFLNINEFSSGNYTFVCTVVDHDGNTASDSVSVKILPSTVSRSNEVTPWNFINILLLQIVFIISFRRIISKKEG